MPDPSDPATSESTDVMPAHQAHASRFQRLYIYAAAVVVLIVGLSSTAVLVRYELRHVKQRDEEHFDGLVERVQHEVSRRVMVYRYGLMGTRSVFAASDYVDYDEFVRLVGARDLEREFPGALGIGYIERVPSDDQAVQSFIDRLKGDGVPWFEITTPPGSAPLADALTDDRYIIKYIEPLQANRSAHGLDIGAHPVRRKAAERAIEAGDAALTGIIQLVQDEQRVAGFLYLLPYFKHGMPLDTAEQRTDALLGWVYMPLLGPKVFEGIMDIADQELDIEVFDGEALVNDMLIYDADNHLAEIDSDQYEERDYAGRAFHKIIPVQIGGRQWTLSLSSTPQFSMASRSDVYSAGVIGAGLSLMLSILLYMQGASTRRAWALAEGMTTDLRDYAEKAGHATRAKSDFLANMSHEIRTPMTAILGFTDLMRAQIDDDSRELMEFTQTIKRNGEHLLSLINDILDMSKIEAGKLDVEQITVRPDALVGEVLSLMRVKADEKKLPLDAELLTPVPATIHSDPVRLRQVLVNLVGNAIKFTEQGGVKIRVRFDDKMEQLKFAVTDTGRGMTDEQVARLFQAFEQADTTTTREFGGTGLGLHISQRLARLLSGEITCNSTFGQGTTFTLSIDTGPFNRDDILPAGPIRVIGDVRKATDAAASAQSNVDDLLGNQPLTGLTILVAEDGKDNQRLINHHLTKAGARVKLVDNGRLAVEELCVNRDITGPLHKHPPFDLLVTDMQMPEMDGYTEARLLREKGSTLPIIALTAHAMKEDIDKCLSAGCDYYASKPIDKQKLIDLCKHAAKAGRATPEVGLI